MTASPHQGQNLNNLDSCPGPTGRAPSIAGNGALAVFICWEQRGAVGGLGGEGAVRKDLSLGLRWGPWGEQWGGGGTQTSESKRGEKWKGLEKENFALRQRWERLWGAAVELWGVGGPRSACVVWAQRCMDPHPVPRRSHSWDMQS